MASIVKRTGKRGTSWALRYRMPDGTATSETFRLRRDAEARRGELEAELRTGRYVDPRAGHTPYAELYAAWEATRRVSASRRATDDGRRDRYLMPRWGKVPLDRITAADARAWVAELADRELAPATIGATFRLFRAPIAQAVTDRLIPADPLASVRLPSVPAKQKGPERVLSAAELHALADAVPDRWRALILSTGWLGWRWSEALGIRRRDVDLMRSVVRVGEMTVQEVQGEHLIGTGGKTASARRTVPLPASVARVLGEHIAAYGSGPDDAIFRTASGAYPRRSNFARQVLHPALERACLTGRGITFHKLRDTAASLMLDAGLTLPDVAERLGHSRYSFTLDRYGHMVQGRQDAGTAALEAYISGR